MWQRSWQRHGSVDSHRGRRTKLSIVLTCRHMNAARPHLTAPRAGLVMKGSGFRVPRRLWLWSVYRAEHGVMPRATRTTSASRAKHQRHRDDVGSRDGAVGETRERSRRGGRKSISPATTPLLAGVRCRLRAMDGGGGSLSATSVRRSTARSSSWRTRHPRLHRFAYHWPLRCRGRPVSALASSGREARAASSRAWAGPDGGGVPGALRLQVVTNRKQFLIL